MDLFDHYLTSLRVRRADPRSIHHAERVAGLWRAFLAERGVAMEDARPQHATEWLISTGWSPRSMRGGGLAWLRAAYNHAENVEIITRNPMRRHVALPRVPEKATRTVSTRTAREIKAAASGVDRLTFALFAYTGCRTIEVRRLTWNDVSLADGVFVVRGRFDKERIVPIHPELRAVMVPMAGATPYVLPGKNGAMLSVGGIHHVTHRVWGAWGIQNHDWRRTVATSLRLNRVDPVVRDALMGWSRGDTFSRHYSAVATEELQDAILRLYANDPV